MWITRLRQAILPVTFMSNLAVPVVSCIACIDVANTSPSGYIACDIHE